MTAEPIVRTRFAPSPSGHLHVGGARSALFCEVFAHGRGGRFILRIEDTDQKRSSDAASLAFMEDLAWLGIDWDEGPVFEGRGGGDRGPFEQSRRLPIYREHVGRLIAEGKAYRAFETLEDLDAAREKARAGGETYRYDRSALELDPTAVQGHLDAGRPHVVRFRVPDDVDVTVHDEILGEVTVNTSSLDDFVILKADGYPTYHFAVVVDDELMGVTHVIRAQEHLYNTPRHILLQDALGFRRPVYAHIPLISNPDGSKMSKRDKDKALRRVVAERGIREPPAGEDGDPVVDASTWAWWLSDKGNQLDPETGIRLAEALGITLPEIDVDDFRRAGYLPEVMVNYLALLGWNPGGDVERFDRAFLLERFGLDRVGKSAAKFDREKLVAFNNDTVQSLAPEAFEARFREHCARYHPEFIERLEGPRFAMFARANQVRAKTLEEPIRICRFFVADDDSISIERTKATAKSLAKGSPSGFDHLAAMLPRLENLAEWTIESLEASVKGYAEEHAGGKLGSVAQPLRIAVSGTTVSPAIFDTLAILGRSSTLRRIRQCLDTRNDGGWNV